MAGSIKTLILRIVLPAVVIYFCFRFHWALGIAAILAYFGMLYYINRPNMLAYKGTVLHDQGKREEAAEMFAQACEYKNCSDQIRLSYGYVLLKLGRLEEAEEVFNTTIQERQLPRDQLMQLRLNKSLILWKKGQLDEAVDKMEGVFEQYKTSTVYGSLGYLYIQQNDLDKALAFNKEAYEYNQSDAVIVDNLAQTHMLRDELEEATKLFDELLETNPKFPEPYFNYGLLMSKLGNREEAIANMKKALEYPFSFLTTVSRELVEEELALLEKKG